MRKNRFYIFILFLLTCSLSTTAQLSKGNFDRLKRDSFNPGYESQNNRWNELGNDSVGVSSNTDVPQGIYAWRVDPIFGDIIPAEIDTISHGFQNEGNNKRGRLQKRFRR